MPDNESIFTSSDLGVDPNLWNRICSEFEAMRPPFGEEANVDKGVSSIDPVALFEIETAQAFAGDDSVSVPSLIRIPNKKTCTPREYLDNFIFPTLLPAIEKMLQQAKQERCFERKRTKFNALDFLTEYLYKQNPTEDDRKNLILEDIPFVKEWLKDHPRPPLPKSLLWTEDEATLIIQSFWRGYKVRREQHVQELRQWQREWRAENENINHKVQEFWEKKMPSDLEQSNQKGNSSLQDERSVELA